jgi:cell division protein FtsN
MAAKRGKSQARRNQGNRGGLPGWAWLVLGIALTIVVVLVAPKFLKSGASDGFFRPKPNPDAQPAAATGSADEDANAPDGTAVASAPKPPDKPKPTKYDFYTMLPGDEVVMSDAELAATAREEATRQAKAQKTAATTGAAKGAAVPGIAGDNAAVAVAVQPGSVTSATKTADATTATVIPSPAITADSTIRPAKEAPYILQAGAFGASGDAEAVKAKVALLGLSARVESAAIKGKTVYRVRMGPYATASELTEAKRKLANGGLPALAIKAK